jgi:tricorn protease interacting factor F2/3
LGILPKPDEKDNDKILRGRIAAGLASEDKNFAQTLSQRFVDYDREDPNLRTAIAIAFAVQNGEKSFSQLVSIMKKMANEGDVIKLFAAITSYHEPELVGRALDFCLSGQLSRADSLYAIAYATRNPFARQVTWEWVKKNLETLRELFQGTPTVSFILQEVVSRAGIGREEEVKQYFQDRKIEEADKGISKGLELLEINSDLVRRFSEK